MDRGGEPPHTAEHDPHPSVDARRTRPPRHAGTTYFGRSITITYRGECSSTAACANYFTDKFFIAPSGTQAVFSKQSTKGYIATTATLPRWRVYFKNCPTTYVKKNAGDTCAYIQ